jgi:hypothetical protein
MMIVDSFSWKEELSLGRESARQQKRRLALNGSNSRGGYLRVCSIRRELNIKAGAQKRRWGLRWRGTGAVNH